MQRFIDANDYPVGTLLSTVGFPMWGAFGPSYDLECVDLGDGRHIWQATGGTGLNDVADYKDFAKTLNQEILLIQDFTSSEVGVSAVNLEAHARRTGDTRGLRVSGSASTPTFQILGATQSVEVNSPPTGWALTNATAMRFRAQGDKIYGKMWQFTVGNDPAAAEPGSWQYEATVSTPTNPGYLGLGERNASDLMRYSIISLATDGDVAPFGQVPDPIVAQPQNLQVTNITSNSADFSWDAS